MKISQRTDYSLRLLMFLAVDSASPHPVASISKHLNLSAHHLAKIVQVLSHLGFVETVRGRSGGIRIEAEAMDTSLGEIIRKLEPFILAECFQPGNKNCSLAPACRLPAMLREAGEAFLEKLEQYRLRDLVREPDALRVLVNIRYESPTSKVSDIEQ